MSASKNFVPIADRLGKLIPRLASDHSGEVAATVAAIGRTLQSAGLDWHDLAQRVAKPSLDDIITSSAPPPQPAPEPSKPADPPPPPPKPKKEPSPWPTWGVLSHFGRLGMFDEILKHGRLKPEERARVVEAHADYYRQQIPPSRRDTNLFNAACRDLWERGARSEEMAA